MLVLPGEAKEVLVLFGDHNISCKRIKPPTAHIPTRLLTAALCTRAFYGGARWLDVHSQMANSMGWKTGSMAMAVAAAVIA